MKLHAPLCELLGMNVPILQAGMGWEKGGLTMIPDLVAAVSNAGRLYRR
jgi:NAD(P)H-dependent flavin oxidoreductase YrpB (nitropropane dioxygenase family)